MNIDYNKRQGLVDEDDHEFDSWESWLEHNPRPIFLLSLFGLLFVLIVLVVGFLK